MGINNQVDRTWVIENDFVYVSDLQLSNNVGGGRYVNGSLGGRRIRAI